VGLYVLGQRQATNQGDEYWSLEFTFQESEAEITPDKEKTKTAFAILNLTRARPFFFTTELRHQLSSLQLFPGQPQRSRTLVVDVTPDDVKAYWDGNLEPCATHARDPTLIDYMKGLANSKLLKNPNPPDPAMQGSLGLICDNCTAICEEAVLEPLLD